MQPIPYAFQALQNFCSPVYVRTQVAASLPRPSKLPLPVVKALLVPLTHAGFLFPLSLFTGNIPWNSVQTGSYGRRIMLAQDV